MRNLDIAATKDKIWDTGRTITGYCRTKKRWSEKSLQMYLNGVLPLTPGGRAYQKYVPELVKDGLAVFEGG